ncbi:MAG: 50S ribosomal protein L18 [Dehalococcoidia bacterium]|nr:50S ribosomal protein L18 [Dehalococcoidia bacterium]
MARLKTRGEARRRRHRRVRRRLAGDAARPRLNIFRSHQHIYAQVIDDERSHTLAAASTLDPSIRANGEALNKTDKAVKVGQLVAERALKDGVQTVVFDRGGYLYHGRVKRLAEAAREAGLTF